MKTHCFALCFFSLLTTLYAQEEFVRGRILDAQTGEPVVFATIRIKDKAIGVISNRDGDFRVPMKFREMGDSLVVSSMGYTKRSLPINGLSIMDINVIRLSPGILDLEEAVVYGKKGRGLSAKAIVRKAIKAIPNTFSQQPFSLVGYYRDYQFDKQGSYVNLNEAIFELFDQGIDQSDYNASKALIYRLRENEDFYRDSIASIPYDYHKKRKVIDQSYIHNHGGNEFTILRVHDAIRNRKIGSYDFVGRFAKDFIGRHDFIRDGDTSYDNVPLYNIAFKKEIPGFRVKGRLYISYVDFAIYRMDYTVYAVVYKELNKGRGLPGQGGLTKLVFSVQCEYKKEGDKMYPNYISFNNTFKAADVPDFKVNEINVSTENEFFVVNFNKAPLKSDAMDVKMYSLAVNGKPIKIKKVSLIDKQVFLFPSLNEGKKENFFADLKRKIKGENIGKEAFNIEFGPIKDVQGNELGKQKYKEYNQFREFFVQKVNKSTVPLPDAEFMDNTRPIFDNQPVIQRMESQDYWMNTPLKKMAN